MQYGPKRTRNFSHLPETKMTLENEPVGFFDSVFSYGTISDSSLA